MNGKAPSVRARKISLSVVSRNNKVYTYYEFVYRCHKIKINGKWVMIIITQVIDIYFASIVCIDQVDIICSDAHERGQLFHRIMSVR
jgi:hypothetical protein